MKTRETITTPSDPRIVVAWLMPVAAHYRVPVINRLNRSSQLNVRVYAGQELSGVSVDDASHQVVGSVIRVRNVWLSHRDARILYVSGWTKMLVDRCRIVITTEASHNLTNWLLLVLRRFTRQKVVIMGHIKPWAGAGRLACFLRRRLVLAADAVIAYTLEGKNQALGWGVDPGRVIAMGNTLDLDRIETARGNVAASDIQAVRTEHQLDDLPVFLFVGRPTQPKRLDLAISAVLELEMTNAPVNLIVIGDSRELPEYRQQARGSRRVVFAGEVLDETRLACYFALCEAVIIPGAVGLTVNHALAYGRPLLTSRDAPHRPEMALAVDGVNAVMVESQSPALFAAALSQLATQPDLLRQLQEGASRTEVPSLDTMVDRIEHMIFQVAGCES